MTDAELPCICDEPLERSRFSGIETAFLPLFLLSLPFDAVTVASPSATPSNSGCALPQRQGPLFAAASANLSLLHSSSCLTVPSAPPLDLIRASASSLPSINTYKAIFDPLCPSTTLAHIVLVNINPPTFRITSRPAISLQPISSHALSSTQAPTVASSSALEYTRDHRRCAAQSTSLLSSNAPRTQHTDHHGYPRKSSSVTLSFRCSADQGAHTDLPKSSYPRANAELVHEDQRKECRPFDCKHPGCPKAFSRCVINAFSISGAPSMLTNLICPCSSIQSAFCHVLLPYSRSSTTGDPTWLGTYQTDSDKGSNLTGDSYHLLGGTKDVMGVEVIVPLAYGVLRPQITCGAQIRRCPSGPRGKLRRRALRDRLWTRRPRVPLCCCWSRSRLDLEMDRICRRSNSGLTLLALSSCYFHRHARITVKNDLSPAMFATAARPSSSDQH